MKRYLKPTLLYFLFCILLFPGVFFTGKTFFVGDTFSLMVPGKIFLVDQLKNGIFPFWNPFIYSGIPFFADMSQSIFYISTLFFSFFPAAHAINMSIILHYVLSAVGVYDLSRRINKNETTSLLSGFVWLLSQPILLTTNNNLAALQALAWIPWMISVGIASLTNSKYILLLPGLFALSIFGGHPSPAMIGIGLSLVIILLWSPFRLSKRILISSFLILTTSCLLAIIIVPVSEYSRLSTRSQMSITESLTLWSVNPLHLIDLVIPNFFLNPRYGMIWGINWNSPPKGGIFTTYFGLFSLLLIFWYWKKANRYHHFFAVMGIVFLLLSFGKYLPGFTFLYTYFPLASWFRNLPLMSYGYVLSVSVLLPLGIELIKKSSNFRIQKYLSLVCLFCFGLTTLLFFTYQNWFPILGNFLYTTYRPFHTYPRDYVIGFSALSSLAVSLGCFWIGLYSIKRRFSIFFLGGVIIFNLVFCNLPYSVVGPKRIYDSQNPITTLFTVEPQYRVLSIQDYVPYLGVSNYWSNMLIASPFGETQYTPFEKQTYTELIHKRNMLAPNWNMVYGYPSTNGYATFVPLVVANYWKGSGSSSNVNTIDYVGLDDPRINDQAAKYIVTDGSTKINYPVVIASNDWAILENPDALPVVRYKSYPYGTVEILPSTVNEIKFKANSEVAGPILIKVTPYPGWSCLMNGKPCRIQSDGLGMKIDAPTGSHTFHLAFQPTGWPYIAWVSGISWVIYITFIVFEFSRRRHIPIL